jgi:hypothetical protein
MLLVSRSLELWKRMLFTCPLPSYQDVTTSRTLLLEEPSFEVLSGRRKVLVYPFLLHMFMSLANLWLICLQVQFPNLSTRSYPDLYLLIHHPRSFALGREKSTYSGIYSVSSYVNCLWCHSLLLGGVGRDFPFNEDETWSHLLYLSSTFRDQVTDVNEILFLLLKERKKKEIALMWLKLGSPAVLSGKLISVLLSST